MLATRNSRVIFASDSMLAMRVAELCMPLPMLLRSGHRRPLSERRIPAMAPRGRTPDIDPQSMAVLYEIKGALTALSTRFTQHEATDLQVARDLETRLERNENRQDLRGAEFFKVIEQRFSEVGNRIGTQVEKLDERLTAQIKELDTKVQSVSAKQQFSSGGWRYLLVAGGVVVSLLTSGTSLVVQILSKAH